LLRLVEEVAEAAAGDELFVGMLESDTLSVDILTSWSCHV
jgi:hypothetical protein